MYHTVPTRRMSSSEELLVRLNYLLEEIPWSSIVSRWRLDTKRVDVDLLMVSNNPSTKQENHMGHWHFAPENINSLFLLYHIKAVREGIFDSRKSIIWWTAVLEMKTRVVSHFQFCPPSFCLCNKTRFQISQYQTKRFRGISENL